MPRKLSDKYLKQKIVKFIKQNYGIDAYDIAEHFQLRLKHSVDLCLQLLSENKISYMSEKEVFKKEIVDFVKTNSIATHSEIAKNVGLRLSEVTGLCNELLAEGRIEAAPLSTKEKQQYKKDIVSYVKKHPGSLYVDIACGTQLGLEDVVDLCFELEREGKIKGCDLADRRINGKSKNNKQKDKRRGKKI